MVFISKYWPRWLHCANGDICKGYPMLPHTYILSTRRLACTTCGGCCKCNWSLLPLTFLFSWSKNQLYSCKTFNSSPLISSICKNDTWHVINVPHDPSDATSTYQLIDWFDSVIERTLWSLNFATTAKNVWRQHLYHTLTMI